MLAGKRRRLPRRDARAVTGAPNIETRNWSGSGRSSCPARAHIALTIACMSTPHATPICAILHNRRHSLWRITLGRTAKVLAKMGLALCNRRQTRSAGADCDQHRRAMPICAILHKRRSFWGTDQRSTATLAVFHRERHVGRRRSCGTIVARRNRWRVVSIEGRVGVAINESDVDRLYLRDLRGQRADVAENGLQTV